MIIKRLKNYFTIELERDDWFSRSIYTLLELLRNSIPKEYRRYDFRRKIWIVSYKYEHILEQIQVYTIEEDREGLAEYELFSFLLES